MKASRGDAGTPLTELTELGSVIAHIRWRISMIYTLISILILFWVVGLLANVGGPFIHALLVLALVVFVFNMLTGRSTGV